MTGYTVFDDAPRYTWLSGPYAGQTVSMGYSFHPLLGTIVSLVYWTGSEWDGFSPDITNVSDADKATADAIMAVVAPKYLTPWPESIRPLKAGFADRFPDAPPPPDDWISIKSVPIVPLNYQTYWDNLVAMLVSVWSIMTKTRYKKFVELRDTLVQSADPVALAYMESKFPTFKGGNVTAFLEFLHDQDAVELTQLPD